MATLDELSAEFAAFGLVRGHLPFLVVVVIVVLRSLEIPRR